MEPKYIGVVVMAVGVIVMSPVVMLIMAALYKGAVTIGLIKERWFF